MSDFPQGPRFPNDCYAYSKIEQYVSNRESPLERAVQDSIYVFPSIVSTHSLEGPKEPPLEWSSSSPPAFYASALVQFPNIPSSSNPVTYAIPNIGRSNSIPPQIPDKKKHNRRLLRAKSSDSTSQSLTHRPFGCPACPKRFTRKHDMERHDKTIHGGAKPFVCNFCSKAFSRKDAQEVVTFQLGTDKPLETWIQHASETSGSWSLGKSRCRGTNKSLWRKSIAPSRTSEAPTCEEI